MPVNIQLSKIEKASLPVSFRQTAFSQNRTLVLLTADRLWLVGLGGIEPPTSPLSGVRSSHLSYRPKPVYTLVELVGIEPATS